MTKKGLALIIFLFFVKFSFAGWSSKGTYFTVFNQTQIIKCSWSASGASQTDNFKVVFQITKIGSDKADEVVFLDLSTSKGDAIDRGKQALVQAVLNEGEMYFFDGDSNVYIFNCKTNEIKKVFNFKTKHSEPITSFKIIKKNLVFIAGASLIIEDIISNKTKQNIKTPAEITKVDIQSDKDFFTVSCINGDTILYDSFSFKVVKIITKSPLAFVLTNQKLVYANQSMDSLIFYNIQKKSIISKIKYLSNLHINSISIMDNRYIAIEYLNGFNNNDKTELDRINIINIKSGITYKTIENNPEERFLDDGVNPNYIGYKDRSLVFHLVKRGSNVPSYYNINVSSLFDFKEDNNGPLIKLDGYENYFGEVFITTKDKILIKGKGYDKEQDFNYPIKIDVKDLLYNYNAIDKEGLFVGLKMGLNTIPISAEDKYGNKSETYLTIKRVAINRGTVTQSNENSLENKIASYEYKAVLISNQNYNKGIDSLRFPHSDALSLKSILESDYSFKKENIIHLKDATRSQIINVLDSLVSVINNKDNLLIFYAGHGIFDDNLKKGYWLPVDADPERKSNWVSNSDIQDYLSSFKSQHTLLITDACFSGSIFEYGKRNVEQKIKKVTEKLLSKKSRKAMTSGLNKPVPDESVFIKYLLKELEKNKKPFIRAGELYNEIKEAVIANTDNNPQFEIIKNAGHEGGEFIFLKKEK
jgi:hypothetical protein